MSASILDPKGITAANVAVAPSLPDIMPLVRARGGFFVFMRRNPAIAIGGSLVTLMVLVAIFAPLLFTTDPTALAPARRTREPSALYWFGTDML
ncbi:MAG: ABC transporter permease, partial [Alphaproteobacteria bacterium]